MRAILKAFGLTLLAALALSAVAAAGAQAENNETGQFTSEVGAEKPAVATGHQEGLVNRFTITTGGGAGEKQDGITCGVATYEATLPKKSTELTVTPHYTECKTENAGAPVHVDLNGCDFLFTSATYTKATEETHGSVHIKCPGVVKSITVTVLNPFNTNEVVCTIHVKEQSPKGTITYTNKPIEGETLKPWVTVDAAVEGIHYEETNHNAFLCPLKDKFTSENGKFESKVKVKGYEDLGNHAGVTVGDGTPEVKTNITTYTEGAEIGIHVKP